MRNQVCLAPQSSTMTPSTSKRVLKSVTTPIPRQIRRSSSAGGELTSSKKPRCGLIRSAKGASSSEKETPTVVFASSYSTASPYLLNSVARNGINSENVDGDVGDDGINVINTAGTDGIGVRSPDSAPVDVGAGDVPSKRQKLAMQHYRNQIPQNKYQKKPPKHSNRQEQSPSPSSSNNQDHDESTPMTTNTTLTGMTQCVQSQYANSYNNQDRQARSVIHSVLESGIASICRLRNLFPSYFFNRFEIEGTSVTKFRLDHLKELCQRKCCDYEDYEFEDIEKEGCGNGEGNRGTGSKNGDFGEEEVILSPLTFLTQPDIAPSQMSQCSRVSRVSKLVNVAGVEGKSNDDRLNNRRKRGRAKEQQQQKMAMEALLLSKWLQFEVMDKVFGEGKLARVVFGICVPHGEGCNEDALESEHPVKTDFEREYYGENDDELVESYSFQVSCSKPRYPADIQQATVLKDCASLFNNLNGYSVGVNHSKVVPATTQSSNASSFPRYASQPQDRSQQASQYSSFDFEISQKYEKSLMIGMSQSISHSVQTSTKNDGGRKIPKSRYLTLRIDFTQPLDQCQLPGAYRVNEERCLFHGLLSPDTVTAHEESILDMGRNVDLNAEHWRQNSVSSSASKANGKTRNFYPVNESRAFVVTPLGAISEDSFSGLCVEMVAYSKRIDDGIGDDEDRSIHSRSPFYDYQRDEIDMDDPVHKNWKPKHLTQQPEASNSG